MEQRKRSVELPTSAECVSVVAVFTITPCKLLAQALQQSLTTWGFNVLGSHSNVDNVIPINSRDTETTVILVDSIFVEQQTAKCFERLKRMVPDVRILVIAKTLTNETKHDILRFGGHGCVTTSQDTNYLKKAIEELAIGGRWFERRVLLEAIEAQASRGVNSSRRISLKKQILEKLTCRERTVAALVQLGLRNKEIAKKLSISEKTVKLHLNSIFRKLGIFSRLQLCVSLQEFEPPSIP